VARAPVGVPPLLRRARGPHLARRCGLRPRRAGPADLFETPRLGNVLPAEAGPRARIRRAGSRVAAHAHRWSSGVLLRSAGAAAGLRPRMRPASTPRTPRRAATARPTSRARTSAATTPATAPALARTRWAMARWSSCRAGSTPTLAEDRGPRRAADAAPAAPPSTPADPGIRLPRRAQPPPVGASDLGERVDGGDQGRGGRGLAAAIATQAKGGHGAAHDLPAGVPVRPGGVVEKDDAGVRLPEGKLDEVARLPAGDGRRRRPDDVSASSERRFDVVLTAEGPTSGLGQHVADAKAGCASA
jgi:hypothetical protein